MKTSFRPQLPVPCCFRHGWIFGLLIAAFSASAQTVLFQEGVSPPGYLMDVSYVRQDSPTAVLNGSGIYIGTSQNAINTRVHSLFSWDVSSLPDGFLVSSVTLTLVISSGDTSSSGNVNVPLELRLLNSSFNENSLTYLTQPGDSTLLSTLTLNPTTVASTQTYVWPSTPAFISAVQAASDANGKLNFVLRASDAVENTAIREAFFFVDDGGTAATRPLLSVVVPEAGTWMFAVVAGAALMATRPRRVAHA